MATVIDALLVTLGLDPTDFKKGADKTKRIQQDLDKTAHKGNQQRRHDQKKLTDEQKRHNEQFVKYGKKAEETFRHIRNEALGTLAVFAGGLGMVAFAKHVITSSANLYELSRAMGISARQISGWQGAMESVGGTAGDANAMLHASADAIAQFQNQGITSPAWVEYQKFGGKKSISSFTTPQSFLYAAADLIHRRYEAMGPLAAMGLAEGLGFSGGAFNLMRHGSGWMKANVAQYAATSGVTERSAKEMQAFRAQMIQIGRQFEQVGKELVIAFDPEIKALLTALHRFVLWVHGHQKVIDQFFTGIAKNIEVLLPSLAALEKAVAGLAWTAQVVFHPVDTLENKKTRHEMEKWWKGLTPRSLTLQGMAAAGQRLLPAVPSAAQLHALYHGGPGVMNPIMAPVNNVSASIGHVTISAPTADPNKLARDLHDSWIQMLPQLNYGQQ